MNSDWCFPLPLRETHVLQELQVEAAPTPTGYIPHQDEVGGVGVAKARTLVIYNNLLLFGDTALLLLPQVLLWTQEVTDEAASLSHFGFWVGR